MLDVSIFQHVMPSYAMNDNFLAWAEIFSLLTYVSLEVGPTVRTI